MKSVPSAGCPLFAVGALEGSALVAFCSPVAAASLRSRKCSESDERAAPVSSFSLLAACCFICSTMKSGRSSSSCACAAAVFSCCAAGWSAFLDSGAASPELEAFALFSSSAAVEAARSFCSCSSAAFLASTSALVGRPLLRLGASATTSPAPTSASAAAAASTRAFSAICFFAARSSRALSKRSLSPACVAE